MLKIILVGDWHSELHEAPVEKSINHLGIKLFALSGISTSKVWMVAAIFSKSFKINIYLAQLYEK